MNLALITAGIHPAHAKPKARAVTGRASARYRSEEDADEAPLTHEQIEAQIVCILQRGDPRTPADLASEIGVPCAVIPYRIKALREKHRELQYRVENNFAIAWWKAC